MPFTVGRTRQLKSGAPIRVGPVEIRVADRDTIEDSSGVKCANLAYTTC